MSHQEKANIISLCTALLISVPYAIYVLMRYQDKNLNTQDELIFWTTAILVLIPIRIIAEIVFHIIIAIFTTIINGKEGSTLTDERDNLIDLKTTRNSFYTFTLGFIIALAAMAFGKSVSTMFIVLFFAGFMSEIIGTLSKIYYYNRGL